MTTRDNKSFDHDTEVQDRLRKGLQDVMNSYVRHSNQQGLRSCTLQNLKREVEQILSSIGHEDTPEINFNVIQDPLEPTLVQIIPQDFYCAALMLWAGGQLKGPMPMWWDFYLGPERRCCTTWTDQQGDMWVWEDGKIKREITQPMLTTHLFSGPPVELADRTYSMDHTTMSSLNDLINDIQQACSDREERNAKDRIISIIEDWINEIPETDRQPRIPRHYGGGR